MSAYSTDELRTRGLDHSPVPLPDQAPQPRAARRPGAVGARRECHQLGPLDCRPSEVDQPFPPHGSRLVRGVTSGRARPEASGRCERRAVGFAHGHIEFSSRAQLVRHGLKLNYLTLGYNTVEAIVSVAAGVVAGSVALVGFGVDSGIEVTASVAAQLRLRADLDHARRERVERATRRVIGGSFLVLAAYVTVDSAVTMWKAEAPEASTAGLVILILSVLVMPALARAKRQVARSLHSRALEADAAQTSLCAYLSVIALAGVGLNAALGWWWTDPVAALVMVPIIAKEGLESLRGESCCDENCSS